MKRNRKHIIVVLISIYFISVIALITRMALGDITRLIDGVKNESSAPPHDFGKELYMKLLKKSDINHLTPHDTAVFLQAIREDNPTYKKYTYDQKKEFESGVWDAYVSYRISNDKN